MGARVIAPETWLGVPFVPGGRDPTVGLDCYGVLLQVHHALGWRTPDPFPVLGQEQFAAFTDACWAEVGDVWEAVPMRDRQCGDALILPAPHHPEGHVAVYLSETAVLHTSRATGVLCLPFARLMRHVRRVMRPTAAVRC